MGTSKTEIGGSGTGLGGNFASWLNHALMSGTFGSGPGGGSAAGNLNNILNDLFSAGGGSAGNAIKSQIGTQRKEDVNTIMGRFGASGGMSFGTPASSGVANYLAKEAPAETMAINQMQMSALAPILNMMMQFGGKDITQRQAVIGPSNLSGAFTTLGPMISALAPYLSPAIKSMGSGSESADIIDPGFSDIGKYGRQNPVYSNYGTP